MSHSYARNANTASLITLCPVCLHSFQDAKKAFLRRADIRQQTKDVCTSARPAMVLTITSSLLRLTGMAPAER